MHQKIQDSLKWLEFPILSSFQEIQHACLEKHGGISPHPFDSLNFSVSAGDTVENVLRNKQRLTEVFQLEYVLFLNQVHQDNILVLNDYEDIAIINKKNIAADGVITHLIDVALVIRHADCQAILLYDPIRKIIGAIHVGWRGNVINIIAKTIKTMNAHYECNPADIRVSISPSLGPNASQFIHANQEFPKDFFAFECKKDYFNLWDISTYQLIQSGLLPQHIELARICTYEDHNFFSYRREKRSGRNASFICRNN
ncbi:MAG: peptidoglycan editing factor PgeF [Chlamydiales bacterium]|nr:peptidoglycan editing factor PgeF [Chlamydiales bacterium]